MHREQLVECLAEVALRVPADRWTDTQVYYRDVIGLQVVEKTDDRVLLKAKRDPFHHTFALLRSDRPGMERAVWKVLEPGDLDVIAERVGKAGLASSRLDPNEIAGIKTGLVVIDPGGHKLVFAAEIAGNGLAPEPWRGVSVHYLDHLNLNYSVGLEQAKALFVDILGFNITDTASVGGEVIGLWLRANSLHHDVAIMSGGDFMHHVAFRCLSTDDIRRAADQFADLDYSIDHGPAAHSPQGMYFLYVKDPAGNRNELFVDEIRNWSNWEIGLWADDDTTGNWPLQTLLARYGPVPQPDFYVTGT